LLRDKSKFIVEPADREHNVHGCRDAYLSWCNSLIFEDQSVSFWQLANPEHHSVQVK
jgi:hypothetical protein